jgi:predicted CXXCH cytochrome family protein
VAVGQCLFCHNPHKSKIEHLLVVPEPGLCYLCHDKNTIELIAAHLPKQLSACTDCHNAHASPVKALLKQTTSQTKGVFNGAATTETVSENNVQVTNKQYQQGDSGPGATTSATMPESKSLSEVFRETSRLIELGELKQAGAYLEKFKDNALFTAEQRGQIARVLGMIDSVVNRNQQQLDNDKKAKEIADLYYSSMAFYRTGRLIKAREGFVKILKSGLIPESMAKTIRGYISDIDNSLSGKETSVESKR